MKTSEDLKQILERIDHRGYPAYKDTRGAYQFGTYILGIDHVQGDPFAAPSRLHIQVAGRAARIPGNLYDSKCKKRAVADYLLRNFAKQLERYSFQAHGSGKSGIIQVTRCGQEVLERTACEIEEKTGNIIVRFEVGFPARGRTIQAGELIKILYQYLPACVEKALYYKNMDQNAVKRAAELAVDQEYIREQLKKEGLIAFVADGAILPRESGVSQRPMKDAVPFVSPDSMKVTMKLPYKGVLTGMGIRKGITLVVGGGYHGKSTLLKALESGVYPHIAGDGREYVVTDDTAMKIRAEDGRSIRHTDISMFINDLPNGKDTYAFDTEDASGSTSQAANVIESMEAGTQVFLIDEDTSATNFMVRDELMQQVIHRDMEPITPFIERVRDLYQEYGISTVLVAGSSGAYFQIADQIIQMDKYVPREITELAKKAASDYPALKFPEEKPEQPSFDRKVRKNPGIRQKGRVKLKTMGCDAVMIGHETIDLRYVEQLVDSEQLNTLGQIVRFLEEEIFDGRKTLGQAIEQVENVLDKKGLAGVCEGNTVPGNLARPRIQEIYACMNRYRKLGTDRIKETLFNMIAPYLYDSIFLDLFAGSGGIGIEALSRGAMEAVFVEKNPKAMACVKENLQKTHFERKGMTMQMDVMTALYKLEGEKQFDYIFMDPPYNHELEKSVLTYLAESSLLAEEGIIIVEASKETDFDYAEDLGYNIIKEKEYKTNKHVFLEPAGRKEIC